MFEFLKNFDYLQAATEIKSSLYQEAIKYMKKDLKSGSPAHTKTPVSQTSDSIEMDDVVIRN